MTERKRRLHWHWYFGENPQMEDYHDKRKLGSFHIKQQQPWGSSVNAALKETLRQSPPLPPPHSSEVEQCVPSSAEVARAQPKRGSVNLDVNVGDTLKSGIAKTDFVDAAKRQLITWRLRASQLSVQQAALVKEIIRSRRAPPTSSLFERSVLKNIQTVIDGDLWKGCLAGQEWVRTWLKWGPPFCDGAQCPFGKTEQKHRLHWRWYFGEYPQVKYYPNEGNLSSLHIAQQRMDARANAVDAHEDVEDTHEGMMDMHEHAVELDKEVVDFFEDAVYVEHLLGEWTFVD